MDALTVESGCVLFMNASSVVISLYLNRCQQARECLSASYGRPCLLAHIDTVNRSSVIQEVHSGREKGFGAQRIWIGACRNRTACGRDGSAALKSPCCRSCEGDRVKADGSGRDK
jgi:hypothetical protein